MLSRLRAGFAALVLAIVATACGSDSSTGPTNSAPATLDQTLAELSIPALSAAGASFVDVGTDAPALLASRCPYTAASQSFVCTPVSASGLTVNQSFTLLSASGAKQSAFDAATTAAATARTTIAGTVSETGSTLTIDGQQEITLSGLLGGPHTLNGSSTVKLNGTIADGTNSFPVDLTVNTTITNLVLPDNPAPGAAIWPVSGTIAIEASGTVAGLPTGTNKVTMTFTGTSTVNVTTTGAGGTQSCKVNLATGAEVSCL
ncbi:MAG: hypothetical protein ACJ79A_03085 [Gemmatimonadaceae bacterium]